MAQWTAKGKRPRFFDDPAVDHVISMLLALAGEVWSLRERVHVIEKVAEEHGVPLPSAVEGYQLTPAELATLTEQRQAFINRIMFVLREELEELKPVD